MFLLLLLLFCLISDDIGFQRLTFVFSITLQMNTYYGAAIAAIDLNNDTWTDLLVGAPLYTVEHDEGRVYVYINNGKVSV